METVQSSNRVSISATLTTGGSPFVHLSADELKREISQHSEAKFKLFQESWEDLPVDNFMKGAVTYRRRRYSAFRLDGDILEKEPHAAFCQSTKINLLHGGTQRLFSPVTDNVAGSALLQSLVFTLLDWLPGSFDRGTAGIGIHQIRITASRGRVGLPAPEGIHEDGHHFVAQVLMHREGIEGGESQLYDRERHPLYRTTLVEPFEAIIIDDRRVFHGVSAIQSSRGMSLGVRDMLLVDFFPRGNG